MIEQTKFNFRGKAAKRYTPSLEVTWAEIITADPIRYPGAMQEIALRALHRTGKPHEPHNCPHCRQERVERAA